MGRSPGANGDDSREKKASAALTQSAEMTYTIVIAPTEDRMACRSVYWKAKRGGDEAVR
jgi:siroheme synthase (precorrin-2 oxidase/ferrochelatase)